MKFGHFDDARREYVITTPATPLPWINYLGSEDFLGMISNTGGGYCFYRDAKLQRLLRYRYNAVPGDNGGRFYYIKEAGKPAWNPGFLPTRTELDRYECRQRTEEIERQIRQLKSDPDTLEKFAREQFLFAAPGDDVYVIGE